MQFCNNRQVLLSALLFFSVSCAVLYESRRQERPEPPPVQLSPADAAKLFTPSPEVAAILCSELQRQGVSDPICWRHRPKGGGVIGR
jgi:hypothetical protein